MKSVGVVSAHILNAIINNFQSDFVSSRAIRSGGVIRMSHRRGRLGGRGQSKEWSSRVWVVE